MIDKIKALRRQKGFTLIELLIVVAIIGIIAAIAIPSLLRSRMSANEASAIGALRTIVGANTDYNNNALPHRYANNLTDLGTGVDAGGVAYIDEALMTGEKAGYTFSYDGGEDQGMRWTYHVNTTPVNYQTTGVRSFYVNQQGVVMGCDAGGAVCAEADRKSID